MDRIRRVESFTQKSRDKGVDSTWRCVMGFFAALTCASVGNAQTAPPDLTLVQVTNQVTAPLAIVAPHDGSERLFIVSQSGTIRIVKKNGALLATPFLTVAVTYPGSVGVSGLLGLGFHPNFGRPGQAHNDEFYIVYMRAAAEPRLGSAPDEVLVRYTVSENPDVANATGTIVMRLADNGSYHNGGDLHFGPDGYLYMSVGDGGQEGGTNGFAECLWKKPADSNPATCGTGAGVQYFLRGKILRIDVDSRGALAGAEMCGATTGQLAEYAIPADNPYVGSSNTCDEIWLYGFRNPWRWSFDRLTGDMWIGDVGQSTREEVDLRLLGSTEPPFYGWRCMEGSAVYNTANICAPPLPANVLPVMEYTHATGTRCAVTGGYRFRGPVQALQGMYFFADSCSSEIFLGKPGAGGTWTYSVWRDDANGYGTYSAFGEDEAGTLYVANQATNTIYRIASDYIFTNRME